MLVTIEALQMERPARAERERILAFLESLANHPESPGDYALTYWADHAVNEVKVTKIEKADRS